jgi:hypothetical protein
MRQLHNFAELRNDQGMIQNNTAKINTMAVSLHFFCFIFQICELLRLAKIFHHKKNGLVPVLAVHMESNIVILTNIQSIQVRYGLQLHTKTVPMWMYVCISSFSIPNKKWYFEKTFSCSQFWNTNINVFLFSNCYIFSVFFFSVWFWSTPWSLSHSSKAKKV